MSKYDQWARDLESQGDMNAIKCAYLYHIISKLLLTHGLQHTLANPFEQFIAETCNEHRRTDAEELYNMLDDTADHLSRNLAYQKSTAIRSGGTAGGATQPTNPATGGDEDDWQRHVAAAVTKDEGKVIEGMRFKPEDNKRRCPFLREHIAALQNNMKPGGSRMKCGKDGADAKGAWRNYANRAQ